MCPLRRSLRRATAVSAVLASAALASSVVLSTAAAAGTTTTTTGASTTTGATPSAQSKYQAALKSVASKAVHFASTATQGTITIHEDGDAGATSGMQKLTVSDGRITERMTTMVMGSTGYVLANALALEEVIGLTGSQSSKYAGTWLSFPAASRGLSELVGGLLASQIPSQLQLHGPFAYGLPLTVGGQQLVTIQGSSNTSSGKIVTQLAVPTSGAPLPVQLVTNPTGVGGRSAVRGTVTFSNWGEKVSEHKPRHTVSLLKLHPQTGGSDTSTTRG